MGLDSFMKSVLNSFIKSPNNARNAKLGTIEPNCNILPCADWPYKSLRFELTGLQSVSTDPGTYPDSGDTIDPACCYFGYKRFQIPNIKNCLNKVWTVGKSVTTNGAAFDEDGIEKIICTTQYFKTCTIENVPQIADGYTDLTGSGLAVVIRILINIVAKIRLDTHIAEEVTIVLNFQYGYLPYVSFTIKEGNCGGGALYTKTFTTDFNCVGPWVLDLETTFTSTVTNFPSTITLENFGADEPITVFNCCSGLVANKCTTPTWNCTSGPAPFCSDPENATGTYGQQVDCLQACAVQPSWRCLGCGKCFDPGDGTGEYPDKPTCIAACPHFQSWSCVQGLGCIDPDDCSGQYIKNEDCIAACVQTDDRVRCCPLGSNPVSQLSYDLEFFGCEQLGIMSWQIGEHAFIDSFNFCGTFLTIKVVCKEDGNWYFQIICDAIIILETGFDALLICNPTNIGIDIHFTITPNGCFAMGGNGNVNIHQV